MNNIRKYILFYAFFSLPFLVFTVSCRKSTVESTLMGESMGTTWSVLIRTDKDISNESLEKASGIITKELERINNLVSNWVEESEVSRFNRAKVGENIPVSVETAKLIEASQHLNIRSEGAFDPTVGPLIDLWGFGKIDMKRVPDDGEIQRALQKVGIDSIEVIPVIPDNVPDLHEYAEDPWEIATGAKINKSKPGLEINLSAIAKGYAVDRVFEEMQRAGYEEIMVEVGGEVRTSKTDSLWKIGLERPEYEHTRSLYKVLKLNNRAVATSGDYRNFFVENGKRYSHILDPATGRPARSGVISATVVGDRCATADALATTLLVLPPEEGLRLIESMEGFETLLLVDRDGKSFDEMKTGGMDVYLR